MLGHVTSKSDEKSEPSRSLDSLPAHVYLLPGRISRH